MLICREWTQRNQRMQARHLIEVNQTKEEHREDQILSTTGPDIFELFLQTEAGRASQQLKKKNSF
jgi:hypothetical protein